jgi:hypothetical protein
MHGLELRAQVLPVRHSATRAACGRGAGSGVLGGPELSLKVGNRTPSKAEVLLGVL